MCGALEKCAHQPLYRLLLVLSDALLRLLQVLCREHNGVVRHPGVEQESAVVPGASRGR